MYPPATSKNSPQRNERNERNVVPVNKNSLEILVNHKFVPFIPFVPWIVKNSLNSDA